MQLVRDYHRARTVHRGNKEYSVFILRIEKYILCAFKERKMTIMIRMICTFVSKPLVTYMMSNENIFKCERAYQAVYKRSRQKQRPFRIGEPGPLTPPCGKAHGSCDSIYGVMNLW